MIYFLTRPPIEANQQAAIRHDTSFRSRGAFIASERSIFITRAPFALLGLHFADRAYREPLVSPAHAFYFRGMNAVLRSSAGLLG